MRVYFVLRYVECWGHSPVDSLHNARYRANSLPQDQGFIAHHHGDIKDREPDVMWRIAMGAAPEEHIEGHNRRKENHVII